MNWPVKGTLFDTRRAMGGLLIGYRARPTRPTRRQVKLEVSGSLHEPTGPVDADQ